MIIKIFYAYITLIIPIAILALFVLILGIYLILSLSRKTASVNSFDLSHEISLDADLNDIAGENSLDSQLDLARAFIETGNQSLAEQIIHSIMVKGNPAQQEAAQQLLASIS